MQLIKVAGRRVCVLESHVACYLLSTAVEMVTLANWILDKIFGLYNHSRKKKKMAFKVNLSFPLFLAVLKFRLPLARSVECATREVALSTKRYRCN